MLSRLSRTANVPRQQQTRPDVMGLIKQKGIQGAYNELMSSNPQFRDFAEKFAAENGNKSNAELLSMVGINADELRK